MRSYEDPALSAASLKRPQLQRMLLDLKAGEIDHVVVYKLDRLSSLVKDFHTLLERFEEHMQPLHEVSQIDLGFPHEFLAGEGIRQFVYGGLFEHIDNHRMHLAL